MRKNIEALVVRVGGVGLQLEFVVERFPVLTVNNLCLHEDAILFSREIGSANDLADEVNRGLEIGFSASFKLVLSREVHVFRLGHNSNYFKL